MIRAQRYKLSKKEAMQTLVWIDNVNGMLGILTKQGLGAKRANKNHHTCSSETDSTLPEGNPQMFASRPVLPESEEASWVEMGRGEGAGPSSI